MFEFDIIDLWFEMAGDEWFTEDDGQRFSGFALFFGRGFLAFLAAGLVDFVNGEPGAGRLVLLALLVGPVAVATVAVVAAPAGRRPGRRVHPAAAATAATSCSFAFITPALLL